MELFRWYVITFLSEEFPESNHQQVSRVQGKELQGTEIIPYWLDEICGENQLFKKL